MTGERSDESEEGSILVLVVGTVVLLAMLSAVVVDAGRLYLSRRALDGVTDAAALAGAQAIDLDAVYDGRGGRDLVLDEPAVRAAVAQYLETADAEGAVRGFRVTAIEVGDEEVTVRTTATVRLPFVGPFTGGSSTVSVRTESSARNRLAES